MLGMKKISAFSNKYLITGMAFAAWMLFFDRNDIRLQVKRIQQLQHLDRSEQLLTRNIEDTKKELDLLKTNPQTLEKYARERYLMKKDNEDLFIVSIDSSLIR